MKASQLFLYDPGLTEPQLICQSFVLDQACWGRFLKLTLTRYNLYCFVWGDRNLRSLTPENEKPTRKVLFAVFSSDVIGGRGGCRPSLWKSDLSLILSEKKETREENIIFVHINSSAASLEGHFYGEVCKIIAFFLFAGSVSTHIGGQRGREGREREMKEINQCFVCHGEKVWVLAP